MGRNFYLLWLSAAALAAIGAATDTSYHFSRLFDTISVPHVLLASGIAVYVALLLWALSPLGIAFRMERPDRAAAPHAGPNGAEPSRRAWGTLAADVYWREPGRRAQGAERAALLLAAIGVGLFIVAIPCDVVWHAIFGVDITTWSPTHLSLNYTSDIAHVGAFAAWLSSPTARRPRAWVVTLALGVATLLAVHYPLYQQEYGARAIDGLNRTGHAPWYVAPDMWVLAAPQARQLIKGGAPDWLYLVYTALAVSYTLTLGACALYGDFLGGRARPVRPGAWPWRFGAATAIAAGFVLIRAFFALAFGAFGLPVAVTPWYLIGMGLAIDAALALAALVARRRAAAGMAGINWRTLAIFAALGGGAAALALYDGMALMRARAVVPDTPAGALPFAALAGVGGALLGAWLATWMRERVPPRAPEGETLSPPERATAGANGRRTR